MRDGMRAGVARADPASGLNQAFRALTGAVTRRWAFGAGKNAVKFWMRRAEDCPPYQCCCDGAGHSEVQ